MLRKKIGLVVCVCLYWFSATVFATGPTLDFFRQTLDGGGLKLSEFRGQWVVINFWATWCGPCITEIPELQYLHDNHPEASVIGVNFETIDVADLKQFIHNLNITYPIVLVGNEPLIPFEPLKGLPSSFVVSPEGAFVTGHVGAVDCQWLANNTGAVIDCPTEHQPD